MDIPIQIDWHTTTDDLAINHDAMLDHNGWRAEINKKVEDYLRKHGVPDSSFRTDQVGEYPPFKIDKIVVTIVHPDYPDMEAKEKHNK